ncbi:MAG: acetamidase/formamidase family protein [Burkholderiales bacterium]|jgi:formamidase|nr:acetamidase/formamidase family protein [Pseudomonadota bacterium]MDA1012405.1 acetamidase/formamidase family protein [Pseudomonadota bacterium]
MRFRTPFLALMLSAIVGSAAFADTTDVKIRNIVEVKKQGVHCEQDPNCFNRYHPAIKPVARAKPGDYIVVHTRDALDSNLNINSQPKDVTAIDTNLIHPMTGPVYIEGAKRGDVLAIKLIEIIPDDYGYTTLIPGFGFLPDLFPEPYIANWKLNSFEAVSDQLPGVRIPMNSFMGSVGVLPGKAEVAKWLARESQLGAAGGVALPPEPTGASPASVCGPNGSHKSECLRTVPPRENGGNMDVKQMVKGTTLLLPCFIDGCGFFIGDVHFAQGDGEVAGTAIETGAVVTVTTEIRKGMASLIKQPMFEGGSQIKSLQPDRFHAVVGYPLKNAGEIPPQWAYLDSEKIKPLTNLSNDLTLAARNSLIAMIDWLVATKGLTRPQALVVASVACDLHISNVVDVPNYTVTTICPMEIFDNK